MHSAGGGEGDLEHDGAVGGVLREVGVGAPADVDVAVQRICLVDELDVALGGGEEVEGGV